jgi:hypothetical protein
MIERSAPVRQLVFAAGVVFVCLAIGAMLLGKRYRLITLTIVVFLFCATLAWLTRHSS